jgi:chromosome segregation ATPase
MNRAQKALVLLVVSTMGLWGCAKGPANPAGPERLKGLEVKLSKVEGDFRAAAAARDQLRNQLSSLEEQRAAIEKERDELRQQLTVRTTERDALQSQYEQFRKNLRGLLGQAEVAASRLSSSPVTVSVEVAKPGKM